jgi:hypothetical protein
MRVSVNATPVLPDLRARGTDRVTASRQEETPLSRPLKRPIPSMGESVTGVTGA